MIYRDCTRCDRPRNIVGPGGECWPCLVRVSCACGAYVGVPGPGERPVCSDCASKLRWGRFVATLREILHV